MHEAFRPYLTELRSQLSEGLDSTEVEDAVCEIGAHLELTYEEGLLAGLSHGQAYESALRSLGSGDLLASELKMSDGPKIGPWTATQATWIFAWLYTVTFAIVQFTILLGVPGIGLAFTLISPLPILFFATYLASSLVSKTYQVARVMVPVVTGIAVMYVLYSLTPMGRQQMPFFPTYVFLTVYLGLGGHLLMVWLGRYSGERQRRGIAS
jgi:hypothetical protein